MRKRKSLIFAALCAMLCLTLCCGAALAAGTYATGTGREARGPVANSTGNQPKSPSFLTAITVNTQVNLNWAQVEGCYYRVYEKVNGTWGATPLMETPETDWSFPAKAGEHTYGVSAVMAASGDGEAAESAEVTSVTVTVQKKSDTPPAKGADLLEMKLTQGGIRHYEYTAYDNTYLHIQTKGITWVLTGDEEMVAPVREGATEYYTTLGNDFYIRAEKYRTGTSASGTVYVVTFDYTPVEVTRADGKTVTVYELGDRTGIYDISLYYQSGDAPSGNREYAAIIDNAEYLIQSKQAIYIRCTDPARTSVTIPDKLSVNGKTIKVIGIDEGAFRNNKKIKEVKIGANVKGIGAEAFSGCSKLKTVTGGSAVTTIGESAFRNCKALTQFTLGDKVQIIGLRAFSGCTALKTVSGGKGLTAIGDSAFQGCAALTKITLYSRLFSLGKNAFQGCKKLKTITLKTKLLLAENLGTDVFKGIYSKAVFKCPAGLAAQYRELLLTRGATEAMKFQ